MGKEQKSKHRECTLVVSDGDITNLDMAKLIHKATVSLMNRGENFIHVSIENDKQTVRVNNEKFFALDEYARVDSVLREDLLQKSKEFINDSVAHMFVETVLDFWLRYEVKRFTLSFDGENIHIGMNKHIPKMKEYWDSPLIGWNLDGEFFARTNTMKKNALTNSTGGGKVI